MYLRLVIKPFIRIFMPILQFISQLHPTRQLILLISILYASIVYILPNWWSPFYPKPTKTPFSAPLRPNPKIHNCARCPVCGEVITGPWHKCLIVG